MVIDRGSKYRIQNPTQFDKPTDCSGQVKRYRFAPKEVDLMLLWLTCVAAVIVCIYGLAAVFNHGPNREHAIRIVVVGTLTSYMVVLFLLKL